MATTPTPTESATRRHLRIFCAAADTYPPSAPDVVDLFDKAVVERGYQIDWAMRRTLPGRGGIIVEGGRIYALGFTARSRGLLRGLAQFFAYPAFFWRVTRQAFAGRYDILQARDTPWFALWMLVLARLLRIRFTYWMSTDLAAAMLYTARDGTVDIGALHRFRLAAASHALGFVLKGLILPQADHIFVQNERMCADLIAKGIDHRRITPVPMALRLESLPRRNSNDGDPFLGRRAIVHLGTLNRALRPEFLIDALARIHARAPDAFLAFIGDISKAQMETLRGYIAKERLHRYVLFTGQLPRFQALKLTAYARVCVSVLPPHPANDGATPARLVEYLALGRPVVVNDHPEQTRVAIESGAGLSVPLEAAQFGDAVADLLQDPVRAESMGARGPAYIQRTRATTILSGRVDAAYRAITKKHDLPNL